MAPVLLSPGWRGIGPEEPRFHWRRACKEFLRIGMTDARRAEEQFYSRYAWCLNPPLCVEDLLRRVREEADQYEDLDGWQREESKANLYLMTSAAACTADDYLALPWLDLGPFSKQFPRMRRPISAAQNFICLSQSMLQAGRRDAWQWRRLWDACVSGACALLICNSACEHDTFAALRAAVHDLAPARLPQALLKRRMRLPEAFRSQDMAHQDVITLIDRFCGSFAPDGKPAAILGLRTAGAYFAPLMAEYLKERGWPDVSWFSIRPKNGVAPWERRQLKRAVRTNARILLVDDYPSTGATLRMTLEMLRKAQIPPDRIAVLAPTHAASPDWPRLAGINPRIPVITMDLHELHKSACMTPHRIEALCAEYYAAEGWTKLRVLNDDALEDVNARFREHSEDGHHVREKRAFAIELANERGRKIVRRIFCKSAGWGWLGYHAYIAARRLDGLTPSAIGLRNGILMTEWIDGHPPPANSESGEIVQAVARYVAARSRRLRLTADCKFEKRTYRWTGADEIVGILRTLYGPYINRLKAPALRNELCRHMNAFPTFIDGRMRPDEWIRTSSGIYKTDFEHHNFGGGEPDIVDPAYDLAAAIFEFRLSRAAEENLLRMYQEQSGDKSAGARLLLHKILYGSIVMKHSRDHAARGRNSRENNELYHRARNFLVWSMNDFCATLIRAAPRSRWSGSLFFMDLDGVFDQELLGFPHATPSGLRSLALLSSHGFSVVINTGRSVEDVRRYCKAYGLPGGVAEFGAVFVDGVHGREIPLIDGVGAEQLHHCREAIQRLPGVFVDPSYEYAIRAYRYTKSGTAGLEPAELKALLRMSEFPALACIRRGADSYIVQKRTGKGASLRFVRRRVGSPVAPVTAIGDSQHDIGMLKAAEYAYAPANCSRGIKELAMQGRCVVMTQRFQNGLLAAVRHRLGERGIGAGADREVQLADADHADGLIRMVLAAADRSLPFQLLCALNWRGL